MSVKCRAQHLGWSDGSSHCNLSGLPAPPTPPHLRDFILLNPGLLSLRSSSLCLSSHLRP